MEINKLSNFDNRKVIKRYIEIESGIKLYEGDCLGVMKTMPDSSVNLFITSPPYWNAKEYSHWETYEDYLLFMGGVLSECYRLLTDDGRIAINIPDGYSRNPWIPMYADYCKMMQKIGFVLRGSIVWNKANGAGKTSWGSWRSSSNPCMIDEHEMIILAHKNNPRIESASKIEKDKFFSYIHSVWNIKPQTHSEHPAPYPLEIPNRLIDFLSGEHSIIADPFLGSGTTGVAAHLAGRDFIGIEIDPDYFAIAERRIKEAQMQPRLI